MGGNSSAKTAHLLPPAFQHCISVIFVQLTRCGKARLDSILGRWLVCLVSRSRRAAWERTQSQNQSKTLQIWLYRAQIRATDWIIFSIILKQDTCPCVKRRLRKRAQQRRKILPSENGCREAVSSSAKSRPCRCCPQTDWHDTVKEKRSSLKFEPRDNSSTKELWLLQIPNNRFQNARRIPISRPNVNCQFGGAFGICGSAFCALPGEVQ